MSEDKEPDVLAQEESHGQEDKDLPDINDENLTENGSLENHDQLLQMIAELRLENDFLRSQFKDQVDQFKSEQVQADSAQLKQLHQQVASLSREIDVEKQTRVAAEQALEHLREAYSEADAKAQDYSTKFSQGQPSFSICSCTRTSLCIFFIFLKLVLCYIFVLV